MTQTMVGQVYHHPEGHKKWLNTYSPKLPFLIPVVTIDGLFISFDKTKIKHNFDETIGKFHFYDHPFCLSNYLDGVKLGVTSSFEITHQSVGQPNEEFFNSKKTFLEKFGNNLPLDLKPDKPFVPEIKEKPLKMGGKVAVIIPTKGNTENNLSMIKETIGANRNYIHKKIKDLFGNLSNLDLDLHQQTDTSWSPNEGFQQYLIKDGNVKRVIKRDIQNSKTAIENLGKAFTLIDKVPDSWKDNQWEDMVYAFYIDKIDNKRELNNRGETNFTIVLGAPAGQIHRFYFDGTLQPNGIDEIHDSFKHPLALDYASSIIDFSKLIMLNNHCFLI